MRKGVSVPLLVWRKCALPSPGVQRMQHIDLIRVAEFFGQRIGNKAVLFVKSPWRDALFIVSTKGRNGDDLCSVQLTKCFIYQQRSDATTAIARSNGKATNRVVSARKEKNTGDMLSSLIQRACRFSIKRRTRLRCFSSVSCVSRTGKFQRMGVTSCIQLLMSLEVPYRSCMDVSFGRE